VAETWSSSSVNRAMPTAALADFSANFAGSEIPVALRRLAHTFVTDNLATMLVGAVQPVHRDTAIGLMQAHGAGATAAIGGAALPLSASVFLDGVAAADFEFEHVTTNTHASSTVFPAIFALAAREKCSGREFLEAMVVGYEVATRIGAACGDAVESQRGFHNPGLNGVLASAAACCRLLRLDTTTTASAMGLAASNAAGLMAFQSTGAMTKRLHPGRAAQLGLESAMLAQAGVLGPTDVLENPKGFLHAFSPQPEPEVLTSKLGEEWRSSRMIVKLAPAHAFAQVFISALNNARDAGLTWDPNTVEQISVASGPRPTSPSHANTAPNSLLDAQYSVPFSVAVAIARDLRDPLAFTDEAVQDPAVRAVAQRIALIRDSDDPRALGGRLTMRSGGRTLEFKADTYAGAPGTPDYSEAVRKKFDRCLQSLGLASWSGPLLSGIADIEEADDVGKLRATLIDASATAQPKKA
jgi:2-methylcitrate dehydratase PrpD